MSNYPLRRNHLKVFIACLLVIYGITFARLHVETIESAGSQHNDLPVHFQDSVEYPLGSKVVKTGTPATKAGDKASNRTVEQSTNATANQIPTKKKTVNATAKDKNDEKQEKTAVQVETIANSTIEITEFTHHAGGVIVTKVHGPHQLPLLQQSMCLLHQAYNKRVQYDIVVFTTLPIPEDQLFAISATISPVKLSVVVDNDGIVNEIHKLSPIRRQNFLKRCNATSPEEITWDSECDEDDVDERRIRYNWQAEFRSWHIWKHRALANYKYMMWIDTDAFCTQPWERDPMVIAMKEDLVIYFDNYPQGRAKAAQPRVKEVFGNYLCSARKSPNGQLYTSMGDECEGSQLWTIHGFYHISNLDFFRQPKVQHWAETMIGDCFLCRKFDDQLAVTVPSVMLAPEKSWDMYKSGVRPNIFHNHKIDGKRNRKAGGFLTYWKDHAEKEFPEAWNTCEIVAGS